jgi:type IV secretory pathway VirB2 component (pilin)
MLGPFAIALSIMGVVAALGGAASWFGLSGRWRRSAGEEN